MNRDLWFTCPVIDFTWQYTRFGGSKNVRLYDMDQTKFGPIFKYMGVPQWRVSHLSDLPYFFNEDVAAGGDNSPHQRALSALLSGSSAAFAHTGNPTISRGKTLRDWPIAYPDQSRQALSQVYPDSFNVYVVGGREGNGPATVSSRGAASSAREQALAREKLIERCTFINSILAEIGA
jgi:carboxylesterase type B